MITRYIFKHSKSAEDNPTYTYRLDNGGQKQSNKSVIALCNLNRSLRGVEWQKGLTTRKSSTKPLHFTAEEFNRLSKLFCSQPSLWSQVASSFRMGIHVETQSVGWPPQKSGPLSSAGITPNMDIPEAEPRLSSLTLDPIRHAHVPQVFRNSIAAPTVQSPRSDAAPPRNSDVSVDSWTSTTPSEAIEMVEPNIVETNTAFIVKSRVGKFLARFTKTSTKDKLEAVRKTVTKFKEWGKRLRDAFTSKRTSMKWPAK